MDKKRLQRRMKSMADFATECENEIYKIIASKDKREIETNPNETQILVYHERERQVLSHDIVAIGIGDDRGTLVFTDTFGDAYTDKDLFYISTVYPFILESVLGQH
jgi:hypothetical protein